MRSQTPPRDELFTHHDDPLRDSQRQDAAATLTNRFIGQEPYFRDRFRSEAVQTGVDTRHAAEGPADVLDITLRSPMERNGRHARIRRRSRKLV